MREFSTGATRDTDENKPGYAGYLSAQALKRFGEYMMKHQIQADGTKRAPDNWKKGLPQDAYVDSLMRHVMDVLLWSEGAEDVAREPIQDALCACLFNVQGLLHELVVDGPGVGSLPADLIRSPMESIPAGYLRSPFMRMLDNELDAVEDQRAREVL